MATQLGIYQDAAQRIGSVRLASISDDVEVRYALDDVYADAVAYMLRAAAWKFATVDAEVTGTVSGGYGSFVYRAEKPANFLRAHSLYVSDGAHERPFPVREHMGYFYSTVETFRLRFVSSAYDDEGLFPEQFASALSGYLAYLVCDRITGDAERQEVLRQRWLQELGASREIDAVPEDKWLRHQLSGRLQEGVRHIGRMGRWRFAIKTATLTANADTPSAGFSYAFDKPADHLRTIVLYEAQGAGRREIEFRNEGGDLHANVEAPVLRYLSATLLDDATNWTQTFADTLLAWLNLREGMEQPDTPGAVIQARQNAFDMLLRAATAEDDGQERARVDRAGRFTTARRASYQREQG